MIFVIFAGVISPIRSVLSSTTAINMFIIGHTKIGVFVWFVSLKPIGL